MKMSKSKQLDCLILALEKDLDQIRKYWRERNADAEKASPSGVLYNLGMAHGAEFADSLISGTLEAAKNLREVGR